MNRDELRGFLVESALAGYASGDTSQETKEEDGSTSIIIEDGPWCSHDNWFGGEPYAGRIVVHYEGKPVWHLAYYGRVLHKSLPASGSLRVSDVYRFLIQALKDMPIDAPYRGPRQYRENTGGWWEYKNDWSSDLDAFHGEERIYFNDQLVYLGWYNGGLVNVTEG